MKTKLLVSSLLLIVCTASIAQFRGQLTLGYATASGDLGKDANGGIGYGANLRYAFSDKLDAGLEYSANVFASIGEGLFSVSGITAKGFYKITDTNVHPYLALAFGLYTTENPEITFSSGGTSTTTGGETKSGFGFSPEFGLNFGGFGIGVKYVNAVELPETPSTTEPRPKATYIKYFIGYSFSFGD